MSKNTTTITLGEGLEGDQTDEKRLRALPDEAIDCSDIPELDEDFFRHAKQVFFSVASSIIARPCHYQTDQRRPR